MMRSVRRWGGPLGVSLILAVCVAGVAGQQPPKGPKTGKPPAAPGKGRETSAKAQAVQVKTFELAHANAEEVGQTLRTVWGPLMAMHHERNTPVTAPRISADARTHTLFVRGTPMQIEAVTDLLGALDGAPGASAPESKLLHFVHLEHAKLPEVTKVLNELGLQAGLIQVPRMNTLILPKDGEGTKEALAVIEKLDIESKAKPVKKKDNKKDNKKPAASAR